jgi:hypothetical protein
MENRTVALSREEEILEVMRTTNLLRVEAAALVARRHGEDVSDIVGREGRPLTGEQKRKLGMGRSLAEFVKTGVAIDDVRPGGRTS